MQLFSGWYFVIVCGSRISLLYFVFCYFFGRDTHQFICHASVFVCCCCFVSFFYFCFCMWIQTGSRHTANWYICLIFSMRESKNVYLFFFFFFFSVFQSIGWLNLCAVICVLYSYYFRLTHTHTHSHTANNIVYQMTANDWHTATHSMIVIIFVNGNIRSSLLLRHSLYDIYGCIANEYLSHRKACMYGWWMNSLHTWTLFYT